jgi:hypothetical protein
MDIDEKWLTKLQFATYWKVSTMTVDKWVAANNPRVVMTYTPGGRPRFLNPEWKEAS